MKQKVTIGASLLMAVWLLSGCITFQDRAGKSLATIAQTVDLAMRGWAAYVVVGKATPAQEASVKRIYLKYQAAESIAEKAYINAVNLGDQDGFTKAIEVLRTVQSELLIIIAQFNPPNP